YSPTVRLLTHLWLRVDRRYFARDRLFKNGVFNAGSPAFKIQLALFEQFVAAVRANGARPIVVLFPDKASVLRARVGKATLFAPLVEQLASKRIAYFDVTEAFLGALPDGDVGRWFAQGGHYSALGNQVVAQWLGRQLATSGVAA